MLTMSEESGKSLITEFYKDQTIFITGGTGFIGKLVIEKLLRACANLKKIYVLVRPKKGKTETERMEEIFDKPCFDPLKRIDPNFINKIILINGDVQHPNLGLTEEDQNLLIKEVTTVFHVAANVRIDAHIKDAAHINVRGTRDIVRMSKKMPNLKAFIYVSTAFSHSARDRIDEKFYDTPLTGENLLTLVDLVDNDMLTKIQKHIIKGWPYTYVFTKAVAENVVQDEGKDLPIAVIRPSIITGSIKEPMVGWADSMHSIMGFVLGTGLGVIRTCPSEPDVLTEFVPVDYVVNNMLAAAWDINNNNSGKKPKSKEKIHTNKIPIYNFVCSPKHKMTYGQFQKIMLSLSSKLVLAKQILPISSVLRPNPIHHWFAIVFYHLLPAYIVDFGLLCFGKEPIAVKGVEKLRGFLGFIGTFTQKNWQWGYNNVPRLYNKMSNEDKQLFDFNINVKEEERVESIEAALRGGRIYLLQDPMETIPQAKKKMMKLNIAYYIFCAIMYYFLYRVCLFLISFMY